MSLDISIYSPAEAVPCVCECGHQHTRMAEETIFSANITHNLGAMAEYVGIYQCLWRPEELDITRAGQLIEPLTQGLAKLKAEPVKCRDLDPKNGWGSYGDLLVFVNACLAACTTFPGACVRVSR